MAINSALWRLPLPNGHDCCNCAPRQSILAVVAKNLFAWDQPWSHSLNKQSFKTCIWRFAGGVGTTPLPRIARSICTSWPHKRKLVSRSSIHFCLFLSISFSSHTPCDSMPLGTQQHCQGHHLQVGPAVPNLCKGLGDWHRVNFFLTNLLKKALFSAV